VDGDGRDEIVLRNERLGVVVDPDENGTITEVDDYRHAVNLLDTMARHRESYHQKLQTNISALAPSGLRPASIHDLLEAKEEGLQAYLVYDDHRRSSFADYALSVRPTLEQVVRNTWTEHRMFPAGSYQTVTPRSSSRGQAVVQMVRRVAQGTLRKTVTLMRAEPRLRLRYEVEGTSIPVVGLEMTLGLWNPEWAEPQWEERIGQLDLQDGSLPIRLTLMIDPPATIARFPIYTVSESEGGMERTAQGLAVVCLWELAGAPRWSCDIDWVIS
jgi:alpha-amylase